MPAALQVLQPGSPRRQWLFRLLAGVVIPLLALLILEAALRLGGYGYDTSFFKPLRIGGREMLVENDRFGFRFFPPDIARMPASLRLPLKKATGTYRIFILGESAALGDPEPAFGAGRYLEMLLRERFPKKKFEVVNVAMTAINSHAILPIARDCAGLEGDLWILYMGNNEMVGPFGAATVFGAQAPPWPVVRLNLAIQRWRIGQLLAETGRRLKGSAPTSWSGMKMFAGNQVHPDDPRKEIVYRNFARNLRDILRAGLDSGAQVLLSTVAVNLQDCPPFASQVASNLPAGDRERVEQWLAKGDLLAGQGDYVGAVQSFGQANQLKPLSAELEFSLGHSLLQSTNAAAAREHFQQSVDLDCLPFRADSRINSIITEAGRQLVSPRLTLFDAGAAIVTDSGLPGQDDFFEHVHLNFDGNYRLARGWAEQIASLLPPDFRAGGEAGWASQAICERRLGLSDWDRWEVLQEVCRRLQQPPLSRQANNARRLAAFTAQAAGLRKQMDPAAARLAREVYLEALRQAPDDVYVLKNFGYFLSDVGDIAGAIEQWRKVSELIPQDHAAFYEWGRLAAKQGEFAAAQTQLGKAVTIHPNFAPGWFELGKAQAAAGDYPAAVRAFGQALKFAPQAGEYWFASGLALSRMNRRDAAIQQYRQAVKFAPGDWKAHFELGGLLGQAGQMAEAKTESAAAVQLNPDFPVAHLNLGMALVQLGRLAEAEQQFAITLRLNPTNAKAADYLEQTRALLRKKSP